MWYIHMLFCSSSLICFTVWCTLNWPCCHALSTFRSPRKFHTQTINSSTDFITNSCSRFTFFLIHQILWLGVFSFHSIIFMFCKNWFVQSWTRYCRHSKILTSTSNCCVWFAIINILTRLETLLDIKEFFICWANLFTKSL